MPPGRRAPPPIRPMAEAGQIQECPEPGEPLVHQLAAVNQDESVPGARGDDRGRNHRLAESGRGREDARLVRQQRGGGGVLSGHQLAQEGGLDGAARIALVAQVEPDAVFLQQRLQFPAAAARQANVVRE